MSRIASGRPIIASKTTFDALAVDSGEETEEEVAVDTLPERFCFTF